MNTKASLSTGWNAVNGHWSVGTTGGEEQHILSIGEMPSHSHNIMSVGVECSHLGGTPFGVEYWGWGVSSSGGNYVGDVTYAGGNQAHNTLPRFMVLAYIMKL